MLFRGFKLHIILITFIVCLSAALGVQHLAYSHRVVGPLEREFAALPGVTEASVVPSGDRTDVVLEVAPGADLPGIYQEAERLAQARLGSRLGRVQLADRRTPALVDAFHRMHLALQEGAATGHFTHMAQQLDALAAELPLTDYSVYVDDRHVYVVLVDEDGYLIERIARPGREGAGGLGR
ncbi:MAG TPA: hypothetical protein VIK93_11940 [Limnochordales bacterium]